MGLQMRNDDTAANAVRAGSMGERGEALVDGGRLGLTEESAQQGQECELTTGKHAAGTGTRVDDGEACGDGGRRESMMTAPPALALLPLMAPD